MLRYNKWVKSKCAGIWILCPNTYSLYSGSPLRGADYHLSKSEPNYYIEAIRASSLGLTEGEGEGEGEFLHEEPW